MRDRIDTALKAAMKAGDKRRTATLRLVTAAIRDRDITAREHGRERIGDAEIVEVMAKMIKQRHDSAAAYETGGRLDLVEQERQEIDIIREFLPAQMPEEEVRACCKGIVSEIGAHGLKDIGRTMAVLKERYAGRMDFGKASGVVKDLLK